MPFPEDIDALVDLTVDDDMNDPGKEGDTVINRIHDALRAVRDDLNAADIPEAAVKAASGDAVRYVSANGNDSNDGLSEGSAKLTLAAAIAVVPTGGVVDVLSDITITSAVTVSKALTLQSRHGATITQSTANTKGLIVTASNVTIRGLELVGPQFAAQQASGIAIDIAGISAASPISNIRVEGCVISTWGMMGVRAKWAHNVWATDNVLKDLYYAGVLFTSVLRGGVSDNSISNIVGAPLAYGISLTRAETDSISTDPQTSDVTVSGNVIEDVTNWEGIDTHAGKRITIVGNAISGCWRGIAVVAAQNSLSAETWAPVDVIVANNVIDSGVTDGSADVGISFTGASAGLGSVTEGATGTIVGNAIRGYGAETNSLSGAIYVRTSVGLVVSGNLVVSPSPIGIQIYHDNAAFVCVGNIITDPWSETVTIPAAIAVRSQNNVGSIIDNVHRDTGAKAAATHKNVRGVSVTTSTGNDLTTGLNRLGDATTPMTGAGVVTADYQEPIHVQDGTAGAPALAFAGDTDTGFYRVTADSIGVVAGGTRRMRFESAGLRLEDVNVLLGTTTGTTFGTGVTQKLAFYGATPIIQPTALTAADASAVNSGDATTDTVINNMRTRINELETKLQSLGLLS